MRFRLRTRSSCVLIAATLAAVVVKFVADVEAFNIVHQQMVPSNTLKNVAQDAIQVFFSTKQVRMSNTKLLYQKGKTRGYKSTPSKQHDYFMEELHHRRNDETVVRATTTSTTTNSLSPEEETIEEDTSQFDEQQKELEFEMAYRMAELEYLFKNTHHLEEEEVRNDHKEEHYNTDERRQLTIVSPNKDIFNNNDKDATLFLEEETTISTSTAEENDEQQPPQQTSNRLFPFLSEVWFARILVLISAALYGTNFTMVKLLDETVPVGISTTLRFGIAALATLPWLLAPPINSKEESVELQSTMYDAGFMEGGREEDGMVHNWWIGLDGSTAMAISAAFMGFEVGTWNSVGYVAQAVGLQTTDASKSAFICSLAVVVVPILDFLSGKKLPPKKAAGAAMAIAGVGFLEFGGISSISDLSLSSGDILSLVQPLAFGVGFWRMERAMHKYPTEASRLTAGQILAVFVASAAYCITTGVSGGGAAALPSISQLITWVTDPVILGELFWTGTITTAFTVYMETLALKTLSAAETTLLFSTEPLWGAAFAAFVVGERFGFSSAVGALLILSGCIFSNLNIGKNVVADGLLASPIGTGISGASKELIYNQEGAEVGELASDTAMSLNDALTVVDVGGNIIDVSNQMAP